MVSFLIMIKSHLFNSNSRRLLRILKILVPGWFVAEVSEAQTVGVGIIDNVYHCVNVTLCM